MDGECDFRLHSDWYSPTRLHDSPVKFDFPGDRFIPNRSLMDLAQAHGVLTNQPRKQPEETNPSKIEFRRKLENLTLDPEGRPFQMMIFRGSPKSSRKPTHLIDEMRKIDDKVPFKPPREFPKTESKILDAPDYKPDFYLNLMDWGKKNMLAVALGKKLYVSHEVGIRNDLVSEAREGDYPASVSWSDDGNEVAVGYNSSGIKLYDAASLMAVRSIAGHHGRVSSIAWNGPLLTAGSRDGTIIVHDVRARKIVTCCVRAHRNKVCGLKWSGTGKLLASGGNDNLVYVWDVCKMSSKTHLHRLSDHRAAVKALAWCPHDSNVLASGGGSDDGSLKMWNVQKGTCISSTDTKSQICGLEWNTHHKEILSGHGYSNVVNGTRENQLCLWRYPSMSEIGGSDKLPSRNLSLSQSPDGLTVVSAGGDEKLRFWDVFGPVLKGGSKISYLDSVSSFKTTLLR